MWKLSFLEDPLDLRVHSARGSLAASRILHASGSSSAFLNEHFSAFEEGGFDARVAMADFIARAFLHADSDKLSAEVNGSETLVIEPLEFTTLNSRNGRSKKTVLNPFILERSDIWCSRDNELHIHLRLMVFDKHDTSKSVDDWIEPAVIKIFNSVLPFTDKPEFLEQAMSHVAIAVLQKRLRSSLVEHNAVAFIANDSILPRKSGASHAPMNAPPAVPFAAPIDSNMCRTVEIEMGSLKSYLTNLPTAPVLQNGHSLQLAKNSDRVVVLTGLLIPRGITLVVGGGYHGKSTMLRAVAVGVYNKVPGDGREYCVTVDDAVTIRAEDGRYVNNCNVSAFISNLPTPPGIDKALDTSHFSTGEASGSTSQAANVVEGIEMKTSAFLVDEDVSAANFMARDGRMRALVMDESITPLLYRVNGLYNSHGISSIVVVGGVGDWLDVPDHVILMDKYLCRDATAKARSISKQFSHGHVQYAGRGVVHRLPWDKSGTPIPRRPADNFSTLFGVEKTMISLLGGSNSIALDPIDWQSNDCSEEEHYIDMSRCEQLAASKAQLYACGLGVLWLLRAAQQMQGKGLSDLLHELDERINHDGLITTLLGGNDSGKQQQLKLLLETVGCMIRPRRFEIGQALTRLRGVILEEIPMEDDGSEAAAAAEAERKKRELLDMWNSRRKK